ncbi:class II fumarate hydratase [Candidatus Methylacidithermus pantelleriae]|uniref:Fumarate hydratase class II n=1 Tax=Candidatus Methylacidithermus pantelleriae TaxID=2744239 RepID=A0A8J2BKG4_9BACT|nr:class II fumarate hydratase [Candidatus Methylacidithermus pantelleriae]CAF0693038.1 Fumarate hydratase (Fumarase) [Candidatus Methylacidithermus pantelleriae]
MTEEGTPIGCRVEKDTLGPVPVPADRYYGAQTARALHFFDIGEEKVPAEFVRALGLVKKAAAIANYRLGLLSQQTMEWIVAAAEEVLKGKLDDHFPLHIWQSGSGTQTNMNCNEVIANRAIELAGGVLGSKTPVHPNDHVNLSQSSNDVIPTALHVALACGLVERLFPELEALVGTLEKLGSDFGGIIKIGRTHLMDALPISLGYELLGYAAQLRVGWNAVRHGLEGLYSLPIGGTAVGTGFNAPPKFGQLVVEHLRECTGLPFEVATNRASLIAGHEPLLVVSSAFRTLAASLWKVANDIRWMASGPRCGLAEITIPENEPGSSMMPGKVNPTQCEALIMVALQVIGNDLTIGVAGAQGNFELNTCKPLLIHCLLGSLRLLVDGCRSFRLHCLTGLAPNRERLRQLVNQSLMLVTALVPKLGYDRAAEIALLAHRQGISLREAALRTGYLTETEFDALVRPERMVGPWESEKENL